MHDSIAGHGFQILPITPRRTEPITTLPFPVVNGKEHRDPVDRLLISQARVEAMSVVSDDGGFPAYGIPVIW
jgi:PIN domain nuclease of toxin-antitoxin system